MNLYKSLFRGMSFNFFAILISRTVAIAVIVLLARTLGSQEFGLYSFLFAITMMLVPLADFGISGSLQKYILYFEEDKVNTVISIGFAGRLCASLLIGLIVLLLDYFLLCFRGYGIYIAIILFLSSFNLVVMSLNAELKFKLSALAQVFTEAVFVVLVVVSLLMGWSVVGVLIARGISYLIVGLPFLVFVIKPKWVPIRHELEIFYKIIKFGFWTTVLSFFSVIFTQSGVVILSVLKGDEATSILKAAMTIAMVVLLVPEVIRKPLYPIISGSGNVPDDVHNGQVFAMDRIIRRYLLLFLLPVLGLGLFFAHQIITLVFGNEYLGAVYPFYALLVVNVLSAITVSYFAIFYMRDRIKTLICIGATCAVINVAGNFLLIPIFGPTGSAVAALISQIVGTVWIIIAFTKQYAHNRMKTIMSVNETLAD